MSIFQGLYYVVAAWFVAYVVTNTSGPFTVFVRLREWRDGRWHGRRGVELFHISGEPNAAYIPTKNGLLDCIICLMPWVAFALRLIGPNVVFDAFAIAGAALMLHGYTGWRHNIS